MGRHTWDIKHLHLYFEKKCYLHCQVICYVKLNIILKNFIVSNSRYEFRNFKRVFFLMQWVNHNNIFLDAKEPINHMQMNQKMGTVKKYIYIYT